jgi:hypothetical protein
MDAVSLNLTHYPPQTEICVICVICGLFYLRSSAVGLGLIRCTRSCLGRCDVHLVPAMRYPILVVLVSTLLLGLGFGQTATGQHSDEFQGTVTRAVQMKYLLFIPDSYRDNESKKWPLIMYLHGGSRRGDDTDKLRKPGFGLPASNSGTESTRSLTRML